MRLFKTILQLALLGPAASISLFSLVPTSLQVWKATLSAKQQDLGKAPSITPRVKFHHDEELIYQVGGDSYFSPNIPVTSMSYLGPSSFFGKFSPQLATVISLPYSEDVIEPGDIITALESYLQHDDVLSAHWLETIILVSELPAVPSAKEPRLRVVPSVSERLREAYGVRSILAGPGIQTASPFHRFEGSLFGPAYGDPSKLRGPYLVQQHPSSGKIDFLPVYKLHSDSFRTFLFGIYPTFHGAYNEFRAIDKHGYNLIPVPSKLYSRCEENGVCGKRIGVKDLYHIKGVPTGAGSKVYAELYGDRNETAVSMARLIELGGQLVGKTKTASFAVGSEGHEETVEQQYPWSARADLWQSCVGSSSGSGCAMGAYPWLDFAIGSDTTGSVRGPAAVVGLYGNRPSTGAISLEGVVPLSNWSDSAGVLARDPISFAGFIRAWYGESPLNLKTYNDLPKRIMVPKDFQKKLSNESLAIENDMMDRMESILQINFTEVDFDRVFTEGSWDDDRLWQFNNDSDVGLWGWSSWNLAGKTFLADYAERNEGREPPIDPHIRDFWRTIQKEGSWEAHFNATKSAVKFGHFVNDEVLQADSDSCSKSLIMYHFEGETGVGPVYREHDLNEGRIGPSKHALRLAWFCPYSGCTDWTIPIGQVPFHSKVSDQEEMTPLSVTFMARRGCDFVLADLVEKMAEAGIIKTVKTGRTAY